MVNVIDKEALSSNGLASSLFSFLVNPGIFSSDPALLTRSLNSNISILGLVNIKKKSSFQSKVNRSNTIAADFLADVMTVLSGQSGHLAQYPFADSIDQGDPVRGAALWERIMTYCKAYYYRDMEPDLIRSAASEIALLIGHGATIIDLGPGSKKSVQSKSLPFVQAFINQDLNLKGYIPVDMTDTYVSGAEALLKKSFGKHSLQFSGIIHNFYHDSLHNAITFHHGPLDNPVLFMPGNTLCNVAEDPASDIPINTIIHLHKLYNLAGGKGFLVTTHDANQNWDDPTLEQPTLKAAYDNDYLAEFHLNIMDRIARDVPINGYDPSAFQYEATWHEKLLCDNPHYSFSHVACSNVATKDQTVLIGPIFNDLVFGFGKSTGRASFSYIDQQLHCGIHLPEGASYDGTRSAKFSCGLFPAMCYVAGWEPRLCFNADECAYLWVLEARDPRTFEFDSQAINAAFLLQCAQSLRL